MLQAVNTASKSQLAKLLAAENITVQHNAAAQTASFDVKSRVLILPVWKEMSNDLYDMLVIHEVGHALDTPSAGWLDAIKDIAKRLNGSETRGVMNIKGFLNVVEDARIDKRQKRRFPGSRRNYVIGYKDLFERDFFDLKGRDVNSLSFIDRMNIYFKGGFAMGIKFSPEERAFIKRAEDAETWAEVLKLTEEIYAYAKDKAEDDKQQSNLTSDMFSESDDEDGDGFGYAEEEDDEEENETSGRGSKSADDDGDEEDDADDADGDDDGDDGDEVESDKDSDKTSAGSDGELEQDLPESETDKAFEDRKRELVASNATHITYVKMPKPIIENILDDYKVVLGDWRKHMASYYGADTASVMMEEFNRWKSEENAGISFMVKEFESKKAADIYSRVSIAKTGVVDTNKLHTYKYNDDIFRRLSVIPQGKNHGFVMFVDWSGSMDSYLKETLKQLFSMVLFCKRVQIPFEVYAFRSGGGEQGDKKHQFENMHLDNMAQFTKFKLRNILSSRMNGADLNFAMAFMLMTRGRIPSDYLQSTPLNQAIVAAEYVVNMFRQKNKVQITNTIFLTDGESDGISGFNEMSVPGRNRYVLQDEVTHKEYDLGDVRYSYDGRQTTRVLLKRLKDRTGDNLIGFFLTNGSFNRIADTNITNVSYEYREKMSKFFRDNNFVPVTSAGYDKYFVVNATKMRVVPGNLEVNGDMSRAKIASAFMKFSEKKTVNRVLLRQFIDLVCA